MFRASRRTRSLLAVLLLLFSAFVPGLHRWQHAGEHPAPGAHGDAARCAPRSSGATDLAGHPDQSCIDDCRLCVALAHGRDLWRGAPVVAAGDREPPVHTVSPCSEPRVSLAPLRLPPARGPPLLLS